MKLLNRQIAIMNHLIKSESYVRISDLAAIFEVSDKTISNDIRCINDYITINCNLKINNRRGVGLYVEGHSEDIEKIRDQFEHHTTDDYSINMQKSTEYYRIINYIFSHKGYIRIDNLQTLLNINRRTINNLLKEVRDNLLQYDITIKTRPHYGMYLESSEISNRFCLLDNICSYIRKYSREENIFSSFIDDSLGHIYDICLGFIENHNIDFNNNVIIKLSILICICQKRSSIRAVEFSERQLSVYDELHSSISFDELFNLKDINLSLEDRILVSIYLYVNIDIDNPDCIYLPFVSLNNSIMLEMFKIYEKFGISSKHNYENINHTLRNVVAEITLRHEFGIFEYSCDPEAIMIIRKTPLTSAISRIGFKYLTDRLNFNPGTLVFINFSMALHSVIRKTSNIRKMNSIAVLTPYNRAYGESLSRRILDRYSNIIRNIEVISLKDTVNLERFNYLIYCGNFPDYTLNGIIPSLQVDYYFTENDVRNFYENVVVPSRIYAKAFGIAHKEDYILQYRYNGIDDLKSFIASFTDSDIIKRQIRDYIIDEFSIFNDTLNVILFTKDENEAFSKLIIISHKVSYNALRFNRIFVYCIALSGDMIRMKTSEKVIRNMMTISDTDEIVIDKGIDFYDYYILYKQNKLK